MLGRQQIRGPGTALSELFKNAHDAYATEVRADLFRIQGALVVRDNGLGMSEHAFVEKWLTLGTESRLGAPVEAPASRSGLGARAMLGEKGIGRLAVAALAKQALVLTRPEGPGAACVAAFVNWDLFAIPGLNLEQVEVPVKAFDRDMPTPADLATLLEAAVVAVEKLKLGDELTASLTGTIRAFPIDVVARVNRLAGPKLAAAGTQFILAPVDDGLIEALQVPEGELDSDLVSDLIGFANTIAGKPVIKTTFYDHRGPDDVRELIGGGEFWTSQDLDSADHEVDGRFDEFGTFHGRVRVYERSFEHTYARTGVPAPLRAGEFAIRFGYLQGRQSQSRLAPDLYQRLEARLARIAGLYVYRDGIRVQPYGDSEYDWLDIEKNRSKKASYYFFSYRRLFGYVALDHAHNDALSEKAGREGFRETAAFREFRKLLKDFFVDLAKEFFRDGGEEAEYFLLRRSELKRAELARRERDRRNEAARVAFGRALRQAAAALGEGKPAAAIDSLVGGFAAKMAARPAPPAIADATGKALTEVARIRNGVRVPAPHVGLSDELRLDWEAYLSEFATLDARVAQAQSRIRELAADALAHAPTTLGLDGAGPGDVPAIDDVVIERATATERRRVESAATRLRQAAAAFESRIDAVIDELSDVRPLSHDDIASGLATLTAVADQSVALLDGLTSQVDRVEVLTTEDGDRLASGELEAAADTELLDLREQLDRDLELAQVGLAIEVVSHEFRQTVFRIREGLNRLAIWGRRTPDLAELQRELASAFEHLDNYLTLLTPLQRRIRVEPTTLSGREIRRFLGDLFADRLGAGKGTLEATDAFNDHSFIGKPAVFYPAFINLVDNALYWAGEEHDRSPLVRLDRHGDELVVEDSGPGVAKRDRERIFEAGFSRKPAGRGLGLYITRQVLSRNGFDLTLGTSKLGGARFGIQPSVVEAER